MAFAMLATAIARKPAATSSGERSAVPPTSAASAAKRVRTTDASSGWSPDGPNTCGKWLGWMRPSMTLASVRVSGPPRR